VGGFCRYARRAASVPVYVDAPKLGPIVVLQEEEASDTELNQRGRQEMANTFFQGYRPAGSSRERATVRASPRIFGPRGEAELFGSRKPTRRNIRDTFVRLRNG